jgi:hypothetical protein
MKRARGSYRSTSRRYAGKQKLARQKAAFSLGRPQRAIAVYQSTGELKGVDTDISINPVLATTTTNGGITVLNLVQQGSGSWNRVGRKIHMKSIRLIGSMALTTTGTAAIQNNLARMILVYDKQPTGVLPTFNAIFGRTDQNGDDTLSNFQDPPRYDNMGRFRVIQEWDYDMPVRPNPNGGNVVKHFDHYVKLGLETVFSGQSSPMTIADISSGALYLITRAGINTATIFANIQSTSMARLRYTD